VLAASVANAAGIDDDERWMALALEEARRAEAAGEVPVGAVAVHQGRVLARGFNETILTSDPSAHAEIVALRRAGGTLGVPRLVGVELFVTLEPCVMCVGAMIQARVGRLVYGCQDPKAGAVVSLFRIASDRRLNHRVPCRGGVGAAESAELLRAFFRRRRGRGRGGSLG
jgi:tRNA(adenine34) deaminase